MRKLRILLLVLVVTLMATSSIFAISSKDFSVSEDNAKKVAANFIKKSVYASAWKNCELELKDRLYNLNDEVIAYHFEVSVNNETTGHILVSAQKKLAPILQYGDSTFEVANQDEKMYYFGAFSYMSGADAKAVKEKYKQFKEKRLKEYEEKGLKSSDDYKKLKDSELKDLKKDDTKHIKEWDRLLSADNSIESTVGTLSTYKELSVTRLYQRMSGVNNPNSSCGPTTGAMVVNYLKSRGYNVRASSYYGGNAALINHMYYDMESDWWGTTINGYCNGLSKHLNHDYSPQKFYGMSYKALGNWDKYEASINAYLPVGLRFDRFKSSEYTFAEYHFVCGIGYDYSGGEDCYAGIKDPDGGSTNTSTLWINWGTNSPDMSIGLVKLY
jgi:hypothetical protein